MTNCESVMKKAIKNFGGIIPVQSIVYDGQLSGTFVSNPARVDNSKEQVAVSHIFPTSATLRDQGQDKDSETYKILLGEYFIIWLFTSASV